mgnify:CR=1 FL=1
MGETGNRLLDCLPSSDRQSLLDAGQLLALDAGQKLFAPGQALGTAYFPVTAVCTQLAPLGSGAGARFGTVGAEGCVDIAPILGRRSSAHACVVHLAGQSYAVATAHLLSTFDRSAHLRRALLGYADYCYRVAICNTVCNAHHSLDQRVARWLLLAHDRTRSADLRVTHEVLAHMVGATRPRVSEAAARLRAAAAIDYQGGRLRIVSRPRLEKASCECYRETRSAAPASRAMRSISSRAAPAGKPMTVTPRRTRTLLTK